MDVPDHIADHPQVVVAHADGWFTHDHPHEHHPLADGGILHDPGWPHRHEHRWGPDEHHHHDPVRVRGTATHNNAATPAVHRTFTDLPPDLIS